MFAALRLARFRNPHRTKRYNTKASGMETMNHANMPCASAAAEPRRVSKKLRLSPSMRSDGDSAECVSFRQVSKSYLEVPLTGGCDRRAQ